MYDIYTQKYNNAPYLKKKSNSKSMKSNMASYYSRTHSKLTPNPGKYITFFFNYRKT